MSLSPDTIRALNYPFGGAAGRSQSRLIFDFSIGLACFDDAQPNRKVLDFACGTGWTTEWLNRMGRDVYAFDVDPAAIEQAKLRPQLDPRIDATRFHTAVGDGHTINFPDATFGHVFCFDSLHHMKDYGQVFREMYRVLVPGGRAVFVEPGARHASSPETLRFLTENKKPDWWIERDVNLQEINDLARAAGFLELRVRPFVLPGMSDFTFTDWYHISDNPVGQQNILRELRRFCWDDRVIFYLDKP
ncbi:MAG: methyltransferase domain-containing protein [Opitutae bacterium]|nr:methyltransferase domain-containing protein [Opitutae bacterium]